jgi:CRISPR-associated protein Cmr6
VLFGRETDSGDAEHLRGVLSFWDVVPQITGGKLHVEVMTPHQAHYYQHGQSPHDSGQPNPILFLTVPPGSKFEFHVVCDLPALRRLAAPLAEAGRWKELLQAAFEHAFTWLGFGAKTAVGYGAMRNADAVDVVSSTQSASTGSQAARSTSQAEEVIWERARLKFNAKNGTLAAVGPGNVEANALAPKGAELLASLPPALQRKVRANEFVRVTAKVRGAELIAVEAKA